jgi:uncharacterized membrane protein
MAISIPMGVACFLPVAFVLGEFDRIARFPITAALWMAFVGVLHFVFGRYCNYSANQAAGVNLTAPVVQLQVIVTVVLAVVILHEPCTVLQAIGGILIVAGSIITQQQGSAARPAGAGNRSGPIFTPSKLKGYVFASLAALAYGSSPIPARYALEHTGPGTGIVGGLIAYSAATAFVAVALLSPPLRRNVLALRPENVRWFVYSGVFVAMAQGFFFAAVSVAPVLLVMPILQLSLAFRFMFSAWLNPHHEMFGPPVLIGIATSITGAMMVSIDTGLIAQALAVPDAVARVLLWRL